MAPPAQAYAVPSSTTMAPNLHLDPAIRDWVVLPLLVIMIAAGLLRTFVGQLLRAKSRKVPLPEARGKNVQQRARRIASGGGGFLGRGKWEARRRYFCGSGRDAAADGGGGLLADEANFAEQYKEAQIGEGGDPLSDMNPMAAMEGMKGQMTMMVQNMVMMQGISYFFSGYVLVKVPFHLTNGFKGMFQRGLDLKTLDTSYVSSVSWYFLVMFGLRAFFRLVVGDSPESQKQSYQIQHDLGRAPGSAPVGPAAFDPKKALKAEIENLELARYGIANTIEDAEKRLLGKRYPKRRLGGGGMGGSKGGAGSNDILGLRSMGGKKKRS